MICFCTFSADAMNFDSSRCLCSKFRTSAHLLSLSTAVDRPQAMKPARCMSDQRRYLMQAEVDISGTRVQTALRRYTFVLTQSRRASISSLVSGVKLSRSMPRAAMAARACVGTSFELRCGAMESSSTKSVLITMTQKEFEAYRAVKSRRGVVIPAMSHQNGVSPAASCSDHEVRRKKADTLRQ